MHVWCMSTGYTLKLTQVEFFVKSAGSQIERSEPGWDKNDYCISFFQSFEISENDEFFHLKWNLQGYKKIQPQSIAVYNITNGFKLSSDIKSVA